VADEAKPDDADDEPVPRLPRGRGMKLSFPMIIRIVVVAVSLIALIVLAKPCSKAVSSFVVGFGNPDAAVRIPDAAPLPPIEGTILRSDMTPAELEAAIERERARAGVTATDAGSSGDATAAPTPPQL
jgi:hypothetical protein